MYIFLAQQTAQNQKKVMELMQEMDPMGIGMAIIGMSVVFLALIILYVFLLNLGRYLYREKMEKQEQAGTKEKKPKKEPIEAEVHAAIAMALHLHMSQLHDQEERVLTINRMSKMYSPWSSKIYGLRQSPR